MAIIGLFLPNHHFYKEFYLGFVRKLTKNDRARNSPVGNSGSLSGTGNNESGSPNSGG